MSQPSLPSSVSFGASTLDELVSYLRSSCLNIFPDELPQEWSIRFKSGRSVAMPMPASARMMELSEDGTTLLHSNGKRYAVTANQAPAIKLLVKAYHSGVRDVPIAVLLEAGKRDSDCQRVRDLFRSSRLWDDGLIGQQGARGTCRLLDEHEVE